MDRDSTSDNGFLPLAVARLVHVYHVAGGTRLSVITDADRSATTILFPESR